METEADDDFEELPPEVPDVVPVPEMALETTSPEPRPSEAIEPEVLDHEVRIPIGDRRYRVRGFDVDGSLSSMKLNLMVRQDSSDAFFCDKFDLYSQRARANFIHMASGELSLKDEVVRHDLGRILLALEGLQESYHRDQKLVAAEVGMSPEDRREVLALLRDPELLDRILQDFSGAGVVGEESNKLIGYLACTSRKLPKPIAVVVQSSSAAGKSSLMESILAFMPQEEKVQFSAMTNQSLFYFECKSLKHKILTIAEEEGVDRVSYALKLLQSESEITIASTGKDLNDGSLVTQSYTVEGPIQLFMTTTSIDVDEELMNRCLVLTVDESREQTEQIHAAQRRRRTLKGLEERLIRDRTLTRHQYQREVHQYEHDGETVEYIEVTAGDIEAANRLANDVLGRTLDELPPQTRKLHRLITRHVQDECVRRGIEPRHYRFSRRTVRELTGWSNSALKVHMKRLEDMEYLLVLRGGRGQSYECELLSGSAHEPHDGNDAGGPNWSGQIGDWSGPSQGVVGDWSGARFPENSLQVSELETTGQDCNDTTVPPPATGAENLASYSSRSGQETEG